jgi:hypothetical protein
MLSEKLYGKRNEKHNEIVVDRNAIESDLMPIFEKYKNQYDNMTIAFFIMEGAYSIRLTNDFKDQQKIREEVKNARNTKTDT